MNKELFEKCLKEPNRQKALQDWGEHCAISAWQDRMNFWHQDFYKWWKKFADEKIITDSDSL